MTTFAGPTAGPTAEPTAELTGQTVLVVGTGGIAGATARLARAAGADVVLAGRDPGRTAAAADAARARPESVDLSDERSLTALAARLGHVDHVVNLAAAPANGPLRDLDRAALVRAFDVKVFGPALLAGRLDIGRSLTLFSGFIAWRPAAERVAMATANGATAFLAQALAVELAPVRVNAISPGIVDSGSWDGLGTAKEGFLAATAQANPARRTGTVTDLAQATLFAMTNPFLTATTLHVDGGGRFA
ncbi:SDR family oxidoreductase [Kineococcus rhizosphaerae]|uniref:NAD(P)-dependent dehydrogenase (Short-subunit alcohol dehydrogenase family) n=1 Tax=Kineococcus rhizosphaerae TaxID=559628 RepID=A0A2T0QZF8_9ACTN|nr:SDR family oxidoreductase [Kineococcus rhizosphaerae]PRY12078.1 NAD(P)-dependent dehydrogenase (short-subunit alcohol dehydrogenase family) [Kineococcus rhizosphaerae]